MGSDDWAPRTSSLPGCMRGGGAGAFLPTFGVCRNREQLCACPQFFGCRESWKDGCPHPWCCNGLPVGAVSQQPPPALAWSGGPGGFWRSLWLFRQRGPVAAETRSSCLCDPQVKDEDKSLAVKRAGKEDGAVSVAGHGQGRDGACPWRGQTLCQGGGMRGVVGSASPTLIPGERWWLLQGSLWRVVGVSGRGVRLSARSHLCPSASPGLVSALRGTAGRCPPRGHGARSCSAHQSCW